MSFLYRFKPQKDGFLKVISTRLACAGVTANEVTALGLCLSLCAGLVALSGHLYAGVALFITSALCDALDGSLSRAAHKETEFGLYFDGITDRLSEFFFVAGVVLSGLVPPSAFIVVVGAVVLLFARVYAHMHDWGVISTTFGRPERLSLLIVGVFCPAPLNAVLFIIAGLCCAFSAVQIFGRSSIASGSSKVEHR